MSIKIHPHAAERMSERGATELEVLEIVERGERFPAKFGRTGFRRNFVFENVWQGKTYATKQVEVLAVEEGTEWIAITVITKFF